VIARFLLEMTFLAVALLMADATPRIRQLGEHSMCSVKSGAVGRRFLLFTKDLVAGLAFHRNTKLPMAFEALVHGWNVLPSRDFGALLDPGVAIDAIHAFVLGVREDNVGVTGFDLP
jgi:hypothetical protein